MARPRLTPAEKIQRGTLQPSRERAHQKKIRARTPRTAASARRDYIGIAKRYAADVVAGSIVAGKWIALLAGASLRDWQRATADPGGPFVWSAQHAIDACEFIERCPHVEGTWATPTITLQPWQVFLVSLLFGWRQRADVSRRRFTTLYLEVARKSAKSTLAAVIGLYHLAREAEPGASVVCAASTGFQARIVFGIMQKMVRRSAFLRRQGFQAFANAVIFKTGSARPVNSNASTLDGLSPSCIVLDESHAQDFELHDVLRSAQGARKNPLLLCPTSAGYDLLSVGYVLRGQVTKVLDGVFDADHLLGAIYTLDDTDDWRDEAVWPKALPMLGITPDLDWVRRYSQDAQQAAELSGEFKVKICNLWAQAASAWLPMNAWDACADATLRLEQFTGEPCAIGADLAQVDDLAAAALIFERGDLLIAFVQFYLPRDVVAARARAVPAYAEWVRQGILTVTDGAMIDFNVIEADIRRWHKQFKVRAIRMDYYGSAQLASRLETDGLPVELLDKNSKNFTPAAREFEARVLHRRLRHDGNACLKWMVSNTVVSRRIDDTILPKKESADSPNKIDGVDAILEALSARAVLAPERPRRRHAVKRWTRDGFVAA